MTVNQNFLTILAKYQLTLCEFFAFTCPGYDIPLNPKAMASYTVLLVDGDPRGNFTADEYLTAINGMIEKGWLTLATESFCKEVKKKAGIPELNGFLYFKPGDVIFTTEGYLLDRQMYLELHGVKFLEQKDSFYLNNERKSRFDFYASTKEACEEWLFKVSQKTLDSDISLIPVQIISISQPTKIDRWKPHYYLTLENGYHCSLYYKRIKPRKFTNKKYNLIATISKFEPIYISGTIGSYSVYFSDMASWPIKKSDGIIKPHTDAYAEFKWSFSIDAKSSIRTPEAAHLTGEQPTRAGFGVRNLIFSLKEESYRKDMLTIEQAKAIVKDCCEKYLRS